MCSIIAGSPDESVARGKSEKVRAGKAGKHTKEEALQAGRDTYT